MDMSGAAPKEHLCGNASRTPYRLSRWTGCGQLLGSFDLICKVEVLDLPSEDIKQYLLDCVRWIDQGLKDGGRVFVHCNAGVSRSSTVVIAYLIWAHGVSVEDAFWQVKDARAKIQPNPGFMRQLGQFWTELHGNDEKTAMPRNEKKRVNETAASFMNDISIAPGHDKDTPSSQSACLGGHPESDGNPDAVSNDDNPVRVTPKADSSPAEAVNKPVNAQHSTSTYTSACGKSQTSAGNLDSYAQHTKL